MSKKLVIDEYIGKQYGRLTVLSYAGKRKNRHYFVCKCNCHNGAVKEFSISLLKNGQTKSCGCLKSESAAKMKSSHNLRWHPLYQKWLAIKKRCSLITAINYKDYGGRGIIVCDEWVHDPKAFINWCINNGWEDGLEIDRENNDGNYEPSNCRFIGHQANSINQRLLKSSNTSGYRGVSLVKKFNTYRVQIVYNGELVYNEGGFQTAKSAAIARDKYIIENNLPHPLNFTELSNE